MVYKNLFLRLLFSILFCILYLSIIFYDFNLIIYLIIIIYSAILLELILNFKKYKFFAIIYLIISLFAVLNITFDSNNILKFNLFVLTIISFDIFSYVFGKTIGKNFIFPISPNKTLEGFLGGFICSLICILFYTSFFQIIINFNLIIFIILIIFTGFIGDLIESYLKRKNNLKNSSNFIPGHGGVFDRFDSFLFSIIFYSIFNNLLA